MKVSTLWRLFRFSMLLVLTMFGAVGFIAFCTDPGSLMGLVGLVIALLTFALALCQYESPDETKAFLTGRVLTLQQSKELGRHAGIAVTTLPLLTFFVYYGLSFG